MARDNNTGKTKGFYERGQAIFDRIPGGEMKMSQAEVDKILADGPRVKPAPAKPVENWYYLKLKGSTKGAKLYLTGFRGEYSQTYSLSKLTTEDQVREWRAQLDRWLGNDGYTPKYKKRKGDL
jgi:hypothetical protein